MGYGNNRVDILRFNNLKFPMFDNQMFLYQPKTLIKDILGNTNLYHVPAPHSRVPTPRRAGTKIYPIYRARLLNLMVN